MKIKTPVSIGSYDDAGMIIDADGNELFTVGQNEDNRTMSPAQADLAAELCMRINTFPYLQESNAKAWSVAKSLQEQLDALMRRDQ